MEQIELLSELFGGLVLLIGFGAMIGHLLKLEKFLNDREMNQKGHTGNTDISKMEPGDLIHDNHF